MFDPGVVCVNGHAALRWTNNGICVECKRLRDNAYNAAHKEEHRARSRRSKAGRLDEVRAYRKKYYRENADTAKARTRAWVEANRAQSRQHKRDWSERNITAVREARKEWRGRNPGKISAGRGLRRARMAKAKAGDRATYVAFAQWAHTVPRIPCYWCKKNTKPKHRHLDHIIPIARGGADAVANLCVSCPACNMKKSAKMPEEFSGQSEMALT